MEKSIPWKHKSLIFTKRMVIFILINIKFRSVNHNVKRAFGVKSIFYGKDEKESNEENDEY